jgi:hypothetical protein
LLDSYQAERHPIGAKVIEFTTLLTRLGTLHGGVRTALRNQVLHAALGIGPLRDAMASQTEEVTIGYWHSPIVLSGPDSSVREQIDAARATGGAGHLVLSIAPGRLGYFSRPAR